MVRYDNPPEALILNDRLVNEINFMHEYTKREKQEVAGFLIRGLHGGVGIVSPVLGKGLEVDLEPHERLHHGESYLGTFHTHPITETFSPHDVATFLSDPTEKVSICYGEDGTINLTIKTDETEDITKEEISTIKEAYDQEEIPDLANQRKFLYYRGKGNRLELINKPPRDYLMKTLAPSVEVTLDEFVHGVMGEPNIPQANIKKVKAAKTTAIGLLDNRNFRKHLGL